VTKRFEDAKQILQSFGKYCKNGLIPNVFGERDSQPMYNTVDASLWYIDRIYQYLKYTNDLSLAEKLWSTLQSIMRVTEKAQTIISIMDNDFLISHGKGLTWMDVKLGDYYPTPRSKKAVEIQALWYNALEIMSALSTRLGKNNPYSELARNVKESFKNQYDHPYDVIDTKDFQCDQIRFSLFLSIFPLLRNLCRNGLLLKYKRRWSLSLVKNPLAPGFSI